MNWIRLQVVSIQKDHQGDIRLVIIREAVIPQN